MAYLRAAMYSEAVEDLNEAITGMSRIAGAEAEENLFLRPYLRDAHFLRGCALLRMGANSRAADDRAKAHELYWKSGFEGVDIPCQW